MIQYQARIFKDGASYSVEFPDLPGCFSSGRTIAEARRNAREALSLYLEEARDPFREPPAPRARRSARYEWVRPEPGVAISLMIRQARRRRGMSQRTLAARLGMSVQQLQKLETPGKSNPTVKTLAAICDALDGGLEIRLTGRASGNPSHPAT